MEMDVALDRGGGCLEPRLGRYLGSPGADGSAMTQIARYPAT